MSKKLLQRLLKYACYALLFQMVTLNFLFAAHSEAQDTRNVKDVHLTARFNNEQIVEVFSTIESATDFTFAYNASDIKEAHHVNGNYANQSLYEVLIDIARQTGMRFKQVDKNINVSRTDIEEKEAVEIAPMVRVSGKVTSMSEQIPLPGVNVLVKGTNTGTVTDLDGNYSLNVPNENDTLVFSSIGYTSEEVPVNGRTTIDVVLAEDIQSLSEVVVVGYGTQTRKTLTGAIGEIESEALTRTPSVTTSGALVGKIQGITARQSDARPGGTTNIEIRNMGEPLYVIDGVPSDAGQFNNLGQGDIESISILKDASAAIYGLRAGNGVILVTTKKGKGKAKISVNGYYGLQNFTRYPQPSNAYLYMRGLAESAQNLNQPSPVTPEELANWQAGGEGYRSYDYFDIVMRPNVPQYSLNASASGGSENVNYYVSVSHLNQDALIRDYNFNRTNIQANVEASLSEGLSVGTQIYGRIEDRHQVGVPGLDDYFNPFLSIFTMWPTESPYANDNPNYIHQTHNVNVNPATYREDVTGYVDDIWRAIKGNFFARYDFDFGLTAKGTYSYNFTNQDFDGFEYTYDAYKYDEVTDTYFTAPGFGNQNPWRERRKRNIIDRFMQFQLSYNHQFGDHGLSAVAAYERQDNENNYQVVHTVPPNNYIPLQSFADQDYLLDEWSTDARAGYIAKVNYNYKEKYLLEVLGRYDGSFLFPAASRWGLFPGISAGWRISEESFFQESGIGSVVSDLKLRASYGKTGSDRYPNPDNPNESIFIVDPFSYIPGYDFIIGPDGSAIFNRNFVNGIDPRNPPITNLSWVTNINTNIGIDFSLFENKLSGQFDVFERKRKGLPAQREDVLVPEEIGYDLPAENLNVDAHRGMEGILTYNGSVRNVKYSIGINGTISRLRSVSTYNQQFGNSYDQYRNSLQDRWADINWGYQVVGRFQSQEEIDNYTVNNDGQGNRTHLPGDFIYKDVNGDKIINSLDERPIGYAEGANPYMSFGLNGSVSYKGFSLLFDFAGASMQSYTRNWELRYPFQNNGNSPEFMLTDHWRRADPFNDDSPWIAGTYPALRKDRNNHVNYRHNDFWLTNVRYFRLKNLELGYNLPASLLETIGLTGLRVYVNGTNLFSFDNTKAFEIDPEVSAGNGLVYPQQRLYNFGFNLTL